MQKIVNFFLVLLFLGMVWGPEVQAAKTPPALNNLQTQIDRNPGVLDEWVQYPDKFSQPMMVAAEYPEVLGRLGRLQSKSRDQFQAMIRPLSRSEQEQIYELTRYPELLNSLGGAKKLSNEQIKLAASEYPETTQKAALALGRKQFALLQQVSVLNEQSRQEFERNIQDLPSNAQQAYRELLQIPELLSSMEENMPLAMALGEAYRQNPKATERKIETMRVSAEKRNQDAAADFNENLKNNPQAQKEMREAAEQYSKENNVTVYQVEDVPSTTSVYVGINPYSYWFGGPYWYGYPWWRPYPYWWGFGFYFGPSWGISYWGWPSYWYSNWFWGYYPNYYNYPYLCSYYWGQFNRWRPFYGWNNGFWRGNPNGFLRATNQFQQTRGRMVLGNNFTNDGRNAARFSSLGRMEQNFTRFREQNPTSAVSRQEFFRSRGVGATGTQRGMPASVSSVPQRSPSLLRNSNDNIPTLRSGSTRSSPSGGATNFGTSQRSGQGGGSPAMIQNNPGAQQRTIRSTGESVPRSSSFSTERRSSFVGSSNANPSAGMEAGSPDVSGSSFNRSSFSGSNPGASSIRSTGSSGFSGGSSIGGGGFRGGSSFGGGGGGFRGGGGGGFRR